MLRRDADEVAVRLVGIRLREEAAEEPGELSPSSATNDVSRKCVKKRRGSMSRIARPPHQSSITAATRAWSDGSALRILTQSL